MVPLDSVGPALRRRGPFTDSETRLGTWGLWREVSARILPELHPKTLRKFANAADMILEQK